MVPVFSISRLDCQYIRGDLIATNGLAILTVGSDGDSNGPEKHRRAAVVLQTVTFTQTFLPHACFSVGRAKPQQFLQ
jgi:hypothetical protein